MTTIVIRTPSLDLVLESTEGILARIDAMPPEDRAEVSPSWLERIRNAPMPTPWTHGFGMFERASGADVGSCAFKGAPDERGVVEIAYGIDPAHRGRGFAKEAARGLTDFAFATVRAPMVIAHTRPTNDASARVLAACGYRNVGEVVDPEDGLVWRWECDGPVHDVG